MAIVVSVVLSLMLSCCVGSGGSSGRAGLRLSADEIARRDSVLSILPSFYSVEVDSFMVGEHASVVPLNRPEKGKTHVWAYFFLEDSVAKHFRIVFQLSADNEVRRPTLFEFNVAGRKSNIILQDYMYHEVENYYVVPSAYAVDFLDSLSEAEIKMRVNNLQQVRVYHYPASEAADVMKVWRDYRLLGGELEAPDVNQE